VFASRFLLFRTIVLNQKLKNGVFRHKELSIAIKEYQQIFMWALLPKDITYSLEYKVVAEPTIIFRE
jgi:hypothetical protein